MLFLIDWTSGEDAEKRDELHSLREVLNSATVTDSSGGICYVSMCGWALSILHSSSNGNPR